MGRCSAHTQSSLTYSCRTYADHVISPTGAGVTTSIMSTFRFKVLAQNDRNPLLLRLLLLNSQEVRHKELLKTGYWAPREASWTRQGCCARLSRKRPGSCHFVHSQHTSCWGRFAGLPDTLQALFQQPHLALIPSIHQLFLARPQRTCSWIWTEVRTNAQQLARTRMQSAYTARQPRTHRGACIEGSEVPR